MQEQSLISQGLIKAHMLPNGYLPYKSCLEEVIEEHNLESGKWVPITEQIENLKLLKRAVKENQSDLDNILEKNKCLKDEKKNIL